MKLTKAALLGKALELSAILDRMAKTGRYFEANDHIRVNQLLDELRPARVAAKVEIVVRPSSGAPPNVWFSGLVDAARRLVAFLQADIGWEPQTGPPDPSLWLDPRVWDLVGDRIRVAESTDPENWEAVTQRCAVLLESELRRRAGVTSAGRRDVPAIALKEGQGALRLGDDSVQETDWRMFAQGLLGAVASPVAHSVRGHTRAYAMGVAGAVSLILTAIDEKYPEPQ